MPNVYNNKTSEHIKALVGEVLQGEHKKDILINSSYAFEGTQQAMYFSNMRENMCTDMAHIIMNSHQHLSDLKILKGLKINE